jgi:hypothetical protein
MSCDLSLYSCVLRNGQTVNMFQCCCFCCIVCLYMYLTFTNYHVMNKTWRNQGDDDGDDGSKHLWNVGKLLPDYTAHNLRRQLYLYCAVRTWNLTKEDMGETRVKRSPQGKDGRYCYVTVTWRFKFCEDEVSFFLIYMNYFKIFSAYRIFKINIF